MVMGSILGDAPVPYSPDEDEDQLDPLKQQPPPSPPPPPPVNTGEVPFAQGQTPPIYGPPAPTQTPYAEQVQQLFQQNPNLSNIAAGEAQANNAPTNIGNYLSNYQAQTNTGDFPAPAGGIPGYNLTPAGREDVQAPLDALRAQAIGQQAPDSGYVPTVNADYRESPLTSAMRVAAGPMQVYQGLNPEIPFVTPAIENYVKPLAAFGINQTPPGAALNTISQALGGPNVGQLAADQGIPSHGLDLALTAAPFAGGGIDAARGLYGAGRSALESAALEGLGAPGRSLEALGGREAAAVQLRGGLPAGGSIDPLSHGTPDLGMMAQMAGGEPNAPGGRLYTPETEPMRPGAAFDQLPINQVPPSEMPDAIDLATRGRLPQSPLNEPPPFAQGPGFSVSEPSNFDETMRQIREANAQRLEGGPSPEGPEASSSVSPPPPSPTPLEITPHDAKLTRAVEPIPPNSDIAVFRGSGRDNAQSVYTGNLKEPHFQDATYYAFNQKDAATYGPNIEQGTVHLDRPLTITNDDQWRALTKQAGFDFPNPSLSPAEKTREWFDNMKSQLQEQGHDGVVIRLSNYGDDAKTLRDVFGHDQAIVFNDANRVPPLPAENAATQGYLNKQPTPAEMAGVSHLEGEARAQAMADVGNTAHPRDLSPAENDFLNSANGQAAGAQRDAALNAGARPSETGAVGGGGGTTPPTGTGTGRTGGGGGSATPLQPQNPLQNTINLVSVPTQIRLAGGHFFRQGEGAAVTHPKEMIDAFRAGLREFTAPGQANKIKADIAARGADLPQGMRLQDVRGTPGATRLAPGIGDKALSNIPGFDRLRGFGTTYLGTLRDGMYVTTAERHLAMDPKAPASVVKEIYNVESHVTGHPTLNGSVREGLGNVQGLGLGWNALLARVQHFGDILTAPGSPLPWSPTARGEAVRALIGNVATMAAGTTFASSLGAKVNVPFLGDNRSLTNPYGIRTDFFKPVTTTPDLVSKTVYGSGLSGYDSILRFAGNVGLDLLNGDKSKLTDHLLQFGRAEVGVAPGLIIDLATGSTYNGTPFSLDTLKQNPAGEFMDRVAPIAADSLWDAYHAYGPSGLLRAAPSIGGYEATTSNTTTTDLRNAVKDDARVPEPIRGVNPQALGPLGNKTLDAVVKQDYPAAQAQAQANAKERQDAAVTTYHDTVDKAKQQEIDRKTEVYNLLRDGKITGEQLRQGRDIINSASQGAQTAARNDPAYKDAVKDFSQNDVNKALNAYYQIGDLFKTPDGKPDWDRIHVEQNKFLDFVGQKNPETSKLLQFEVSGTKPATNPLDKLYEAAQPVVQKYFGDIKDPYARANERRGNPGEDAILNLLGYESKTLTPQAAQILQQARSSLPDSAAPVGARGQGVAAPAEAVQPPPAQPAQAPAQPVQTGAAIGPNGRSVAQIAGNPYLSDEERNFYFQSRGLSVPPVGQQGTTTRGNVPTGSGDAFTMDAKGRTAPINGADIAPYAQKWGVPAGPLALLMNHEGNGAHDTSETFDKNGNPTGIDPARWGLTMTTARSMMHDPTFDTRTLTPPLAYDLAAQYISQGMEANRGDAAKAFGSFFIGQSGVDKAAARGGDWVKNADQIAYDTLINGQHVYGTHSMSDFLSYLGLR